MAGAQEAHHRLQHQLALSDLSLDPLLQVDPPNMISPTAFPCFSTIDLLESSSEAGVGAGAGASDIFGPMLPDVDLFQATSPNFQVPPIEDISWFDPGQFLHSTPGISPEFQVSPDEDCSWLESDFSLQPTSAPMLVGNEFSFSSMDSTFDAITSPSDGALEASDSFWYPTEKPQDSNWYSQGFESGPDLSNISWHEQVQECDTPPSLLEHTDFTDSNEFAMNMVLPSETADPVGPASASASFLQTLEPDEKLLADALLKDIARLDALQRGQRLATLTDEEIERLMTFREDSQDD
ncbi:hypothetical protein ACMFMG_003735 [Clarireedia jacksonii]